MQQFLRQKMCIQDFEVWVHLGCTIEEQKHAQPVHYNFELSYELSYELSIEPNFGPNFTGAVLGCKTDKLEDTVDYVKITSILKMISTEQAYHLIEHLNHQSFTGIVEYLKSRNVKGEVKLSVKKIRVPVENLRNGVVFSCETKL